ncbi:DUF86 domain-containing protein [Psychrobacillus sp. NPDC096426]|uniref:DUF86 domain-containing protein n=1 Tax=Psychrobacillus sp. NPDC096426 TaxID=3364491 RepID=UPI0038061727
MYFVDRKKIAETIAHMKKLLTLIEGNTDWHADEHSKLALERVGHNMIESIIDVGNSMIDGFIMRDPGGYDDIIDILTDEKVIPHEMDAPLKEVIEYRKELVRQFYAVDHKKLENILVSNISFLKQFPTQVENYLVHELGPVSAFLPEDSNVKL